MQVLDFCKEKEKNAPKTLASNVSILDYEAHDHRYKLIPRTDDLVSSEIKIHERNCTLNEREDKVLRPDDEVKNLTAVINAFCHPEIICQVQNKFLKCFFLFFVIKTG